MSTSFVLNNIEEGAPHFIAAVDSKVVGWCDITYKIDRSLLIQKY
jgi:hypothetical protein